ncbi:uncharacterized protein DFE_1991 [Desulfovibrio ferrophilus]|uniref:Uncharacterized protein n=2 Tax=Desulfovibrio ferrophilus TaxID=241368 RepID=A0A2Z6AZL4_9BACT|nr:uncharacterized protein DFE_1991 [Desulfovibrio ferrophilus]
MIELSIVLVIVGLIISAGAVGWTSVLEGRRIAKTASALYQAKECLIKRMFYSNRYPTYTGNTTTGTAADNTLCDDNTRHDLMAFDVDNCFCSLRDAWGQPLYFLEGVYESSPGVYTPMSDSYIVRNEAQGQTPVYPDSTSSIVNKDGVTINNIAFVLISFGRDRTPDNTSYQALFSAPNDSQIAIINPGGTIPDFSTNDVGLTVDVQSRDDQIYYVTGPELSGILTR